MKTCSSCGISKEKNLFSKSSNSKDGLEGRCRDCFSKKWGSYYLKNKEKRKKLRKPLSKEKVLFYSAKNRAKAEGSVFELKLSDIVIPSHCPVLGIELVCNNKVASFNSPSIDRLVPSLGYKPDNIWIISHRANTIKNDASLEELRLVLVSLEKELAKRNLLK